MDGHEGQAQPNGFYFNGLLANEEASLTQVLDKERWSRAENRVAELIALVQPNQPSEDHRNAVESYLRCLIMKCFCFSCQVLAYGSVPLKTYLPDGDIDLTVIIDKNKDLKRCHVIVKQVLENEMKRGDTKFCVKDVQIILARVPIVKCIVENIAVDISFNQFGGLQALDFLENVDNEMNNNHIFKNSILLIKAWCYYESRILGARHNLISTYALEMLVLYIFRAFNNKFAGPLEVLYRFLGFFGKFDWDNFCVSLVGPVPRSSITAMAAADPPRRDAGELLLSKSVSSLGHGNPHFMLKYFNIIDPLLCNNNLGNSVTKGNFHRIVGAFSYGARQLAILLDCPEEYLIDKVDHFFRNTWKRHRKGSRPDTPSPEIDGSYGFRKNLSNTSIEMKENSTGSDSNVMVKCDSHAPHGVPSQHGKQSSKQISRTCHVSVVSHTESQKVFANTTSSMASDQTKGFQNISSYENSQTDKGSSSRLDCLRNEVHVRNLYGRPHFSPEFMDISTEGPSRQRHSSVSESGNDWTAPKRSNNNRRNRFRKGPRNWGPQVLDNHIARFPIEDRLTSEQSEFNQSNAVANSHGASNSYFGDSGLGSMATWSHSNTVPEMCPLPTVNPSRGSHSGIALPSAVMPYQQDPNLGYGCPAEPPGYGYPTMQPGYGYGYPTMQPGYGYPAVQPGYGYNPAAEHFSGVDEASHVHEDPSSVHLRCRGSHSGIALPQVVMPNLQGPNLGYGYPAVQPGYCYPAVQPGYGYHLAAEHFSGVEASHVHEVPSSVHLRCRGSHSGIALPPVVMPNQQDPNLGYGCPAAQPGYGYPAVQPGYSYHPAAEHFSGVDEASHAHEDPSSVHDSEFPSPD